MKKHVLLEKNSANGFSGDVVFQYGTAIIGGIESDAVLMIGKQLDCRYGDGVKINIEAEKGNTELIALLNAVIADLQGGTA